MTYEGCIFCGIVDGSVQHWTIAEDEHAMAFLNRAPATRGHTLVVPKMHADDIWSISSEAWESTMRLTKQVAHFLDERLSPDGMTLFQSNRAHGWQTVFHLHMHLVPRYVDDGLVPPWQREFAAESELDEVFSELSPAP